MPPNDIELMRSFLLSSSKELQELFEKIVRGYETQILGLNSRVQSHMTLPQLDSNINYFRSQMQALSQRFKEPS